MTYRHITGAAGAALLAALLTTAPVRADSSSPLLAAYYDRQMAIVGGKIYVWRGNAGPKPLTAISLTGAKQVGVGRDVYYVLSGDGVLRGIGDAPSRIRTLMEGVSRFAAGQSGVLAIKTDGALWWIEATSGNPRRIAADVAAAAVGDGANYYVTRLGALFVKGLAHRGQYGNGRLTSTDRFVQTFAGVAQITAHTGHAILRSRSGDVMGTGGNIYGPVGRHGLGDKAVRWSRILSGVAAIATGSSHSLAIRPDGTLMAWGADYGPDPVQIMTAVTAVAAGSTTTVALKRDGSLWQWDRAGARPRRLMFN